MRLSTKGHYGLHAVMNLAARYGQGAVLLRELCQAHGFSEKYLEQLLRSLRQAGLVESVRGAKGGYWLARPPEEITLLQVVEALEGDLHHPPSQCKGECAKHERCALLESWWSSSEVLRQALAQQTVGDLLRRQKEMDQKKVALGYAI